MVYFRALLFSQATFPTHCVSFLVYRCFAYIAWTRSADLPCPALAIACALCPVLYCCCRGTPSHSAFDDVPSAFADLLYTCLQLLPLRTSVTMPALYTPVYTLPLLPCRAPWFCLAVLTVTSGRKEGTFYSSYTAFIPCQPTAAGGGSTFNLTPYILGHMLYCILLRAHLYGSSPKTTSSCWRHIYYAMGRNSAFWFPCAYAACHATCAWHRRRYCGCHRALFACYRRIH